MPKLNSVTWSDRGMQAGRAAAGKPVANPWSKGRSQDRRIGLHRLLLASTACVALAPALPAGAADWTGAVSTDWFDNGNWNPFAPTIGTIANINTVAPGPNIVGLGAIADELNVGFTGPGGLTIMGGGSLLTTNTYIARTTALGAVLVTGNGSSWTNTVDFNVGYQDQGTLTIAAGGSVIVHGKSAIGFSASSLGLVSVSGPNSAWTVVGPLSIGNFGDGTLNIGAGGTVNSADATLAVQAGSQGKAAVTGGTWASSGQIVVGGAGAGTLEVAAGGVLNSGSGVVGNAAAGTGEATVSGAGSRWTTTGNLVVGAQGNGQLTIANGGAVLNNNDVIVGDAGIGQVTVTGANSNWTVTGTNVLIGNGGSGSARVEAGGVVQTGNVRLGQLNGGGSGNAEVTGANSRWDSSGAFSIGRAGNGTMTVLDGGKVTSGTLELGFNPTGVGTLTVSGIGSSWLGSADLHVGAAGTGALTIADGGVVNVAGTAHIATAASSVGTLNIGRAKGLAAAAPGSFAASAISFGSGSGKIVFNHSSDSYQFTAGMSGTGAIEVVSGRTSMTGDSSGFTGTTTVESGALAVNGQLGGVLDVWTGGRLGGVGTVGSTVVSGTIAPGNSIGTLNVAGNITFNPGSTYEVEIDAAGASDRIVATGTATINGGSVNVLAGTGNYAQQTQYTILTAAGGRNGTFTGVTSNLAFLDPTLGYDANNVYLTMTRNGTSFTNVGLTWNQVSAGGGVESLGPGNSIHNAVLNLSADQARNAFDQLSGEIHASARTALIEDSRFMRNAVNDRLRAAVGSTGAAGEPVVTYQNGKPVAAPATTDRFALWGQGFGSWGRTDGDGNAAKLERRTAGFFIGADAPVFDNWRLGAVAGYSRTDFDVKGRQSSGTSDNYHLGLYGGATWGALALRTGAAYTWHDIATNRTVGFPGFGDRLSGDYGAATAQIFGELAYGFTMGATRIEPFANLAYVNLHTDGFRETGGAAALIGTSADTDATFTTLGLRAQTTFNLGGANLTAKATLGWRHAFGDVTPLASLRFAGGGNGFGIAGVPIARNAAVIEAGLDYAIAPNATLGLSYGGQFGSGTADHAAKANLNVRF